MRFPLTRVRSVFGPMNAYANDHVTRHMVDFGAHTRPEIAFLLSAVREGDKVFDLGAHIGCFTIPIARKVGTAGRVLAVEAVAANAWMVTLNAELNGVTDRVAVRCELIAPSNRYQPVHERRNTGATFFRPSRSRWRGKVTTIDTLCADTFVPDVVKIDLEGLESWALTASAVVKTRKPAVYAEMSARHTARAGGSTVLLWGLFRELGYHVFRNAGVRHARHDQFVVREMTTLKEGGPFFDLLAIHRDDPRLSAFR